MNKMNYPADLKPFHKRYLETFDWATMQKEFNALIAGKVFRDPAPTVDKILIMPLTDLFNFSTELMPLLNNGEKDTLKSIFNYDDRKKGSIYQNEIALFFMRSTELNLSVCYFCGIDYVYSFRELNDYSDGMDLIRRGNREQWKLIEGIGDAYADVIEMEGSHVNSIDELNISANARQNLKQLNASMTSHFTLDHVLDKGNNPVTALSLYNLVPSCYTCNSKLKSIRQLVDDALHCLISPTSPQFNLHQMANFRLYFNSQLHHDWQAIHQENDFILDLDMPIASKAIFDKFLELFKIRARYVFHKKQVVRLIENARRYDKTQIDEIAKLLNVPGEEIKKDIFGREIFEPNSNFIPLAKLRRDIATQIGVV